MTRTATVIIWSEATAVLARADRLGREVFPLTSSGWEPPVDVLETEAGLLFVVALPGVRREDMEIVIDHGEIMIRGARRWPAPTQPGRPRARVHRVELPHGLFERRLPLPPGSFQLAAQEHVDGCLLLTLQRLA